MLTFVFGILFSVVVSTTSWADVPPTICPDPDLRCTPRMEQVETRFKEAKAILKTGIPLVASGECFHLSRHYDPKHVHYGAVYLDTQDGQTFFNGSFGFFFPENPYADWDLERARQYYPDPFKYPLKTDLNEAWIDYIPDEPGKWRFWLRENPATRDILVISRWGGEQWMFCELKRQTSL